MADFRRWLYAFAVVALVAGLTVPASAQNTIQCQTNTSVPPVVRSQGYAELVGDLVLLCTGGVPTQAGVSVPPVNVTVFLTTNITSKLLDSGGLFSEALLIIDDPNSPGPNSNRPILNCGGTGAPDTGGSGPGICAIVSNGNAQQTYDGTENGWGIAAGTLGLLCDGAGGRPAAGTFGCGRPNVFQGRISQNSGLSNSIVFLGVPLDPPGTGTTRTLRVTNVRADAEFIGVSGNFTTNSLTMSIAVNGNTSLSINNPNQIVAFVQNGLTVSVANPRLDFIQCQTENGKLFAGGTGNSFNYLQSPFGGNNGGGNNSGPTGCDPAKKTCGAPLVRFQEGFGTSWKPKNISYVTTYGTYNGSGYVYNGVTVDPPSDQNQNVPGTINYNTETGFSYTSNAATSVPNPPTGIGTGPVTNNHDFFTSASTGINGAGVADQGTRLVLQFQNVPQGSQIYVPPIIYLYRQGTASPTPNPAAFSAGVSTGVMMLTTTDSNGKGGFKKVTTGTSLQQVSVTGGSGLAVYEILFADPSSLEVADVPVVVAFVSDLTSNLPVGLPVTGTKATVLGSFAPFYSSAAARAPSNSLPVPRFTTQPGTPTDLFLINKCACNLLFPFVTTQAGFDTGIAIANASLDPGSSAGFFANAQTGSVDFYFFGIGTPTGGAAPPKKTSALIPPGQVLTYDLYSGGGSIGANPNGLAGPEASSFQGYIIAQAQFQWCHGFAFISNLGDVRYAEGYLAIVLDQVGLARTLQPGENQGH